jgi:hypothetical protein
MAWVVSSPYGSLPMRWWSCIECGEGDGQDAADVTPAADMRAGAATHCSEAGHMVRYVHGQEELLVPLATEPPPRLEIEAGRG